VGVGDGVEVVLVVTVAVLELDAVGDGVVVVDVVSVAVLELDVVGVTVVVGEDDEVPLDVSEEVEERVEVCVGVELQEGVAVFEQLKSDVEPKGHALGQPQRVHDDKPLKLHVPARHNVGFKESKGQ